MLNAWKIWESGTLCSAKTDYHKVKIHLTLLQKISIYLKIYHIKEKKIINESI